MATRKANKGDSTKAVGYLRVSTSDQNLGPIAQRAAIESWAKANGVTVVAWHCDQGVSGGADLADRPALVAALGELRAVHAGVLVIAKRDRLARDTVVAGLIERAVDQCGAAVVSADGVGNGSDPASQFMKSVIDAAGAYEKALIQARTRAALAAKKAKGERTGTVRFGYRLADDGVSLIEDADEQAVRRLVLDARARGLSLRDIVAELESQGVTGRTGKPLAVTQVRNIVRAA